MNFCQGRSPQSQCTEHVGRSQRLRCMRHPTAPEPPRTATCAHLQCRRSLQIPITVPTTRASSILRSTTPAVALGVVGCVWRASLIALELPPGSDEAADDWTEATLPDAKLDYRSRRGPFETFALFQGVVRQGSSGPVFLGQVRGLAKLFRRSVKPTSKTCSHLQGTTDSSTREQISEIQAPESEY